MTKTVHFKGKEVCYSLKGLDMTSAIIRLWILTSIIFFHPSDARCSGIDGTAQTQDRQESSSPSDLGVPPGTYKILSENEKIIIPFEFYRNKFRFKTVVNGRECHFMFDNGSLWDELLFFGSPSVDSIGFEISGETNIGNAKADVAEKITIGFTDVVFYEQTAVITHYNPDLPNPWEGFDGQVSATFLKHFVVRIDFDDSCIELIPPDRFTYTGTGRVFSMHPGPFNSRTMTAEINVCGEEPVTLDLLIDVGGLYPLYLPIGRDERITLPPDAVEAPFGSGLFSQKGYEGKIGSIRLGDYIFEDVPAAFTVVDKDSNIYGNTMIGLPLLRRFNVVFDYFNEQIILEPSELFGETF